MTADITKNGDELSVVIDGRLDSSTASELDEKLKAHMDSSTKKLTIDLENVDFISSKGLRVLVGAYRALNGGEVELLSPNKSVTEVLKLSGLLNIFTVK